MKRSWTALAVALSSIFVIAGCNDYGNTFQNNTGASVSFLSPANISAGSPQFTLTVNGVGFVAKTFIEWNGKKLTTTDNLNSAGAIVSVSAEITPDLVAKPGAVTVITQNPFKGAGANGLSNPVTFIINFPPNPVPTFTSLTPSSIAACGSSCGDASFTVDIQGTNFLSSSSDPTQVSQVRWTAGATQTILATTSVSTTDIKATVPGSLYSTAGTAMVTVFNPAAPQVPVTGGTPLPSGGGGGSSNSQMFTITSDGSASAHATKSLLPEETPTVSSDGRFVSYTGTENGHTQIFLRDTCEGAPAGCKPQTSLLSTAADGTAANDDSNSPSLSASGRYVAFSSAATNLVENAPAGRQIYVHDTCAGSDGSCSPSTQIASTDSNGLLTGTTSLLPTISASGRFVAFLAVTPSHAGHQQASTSSNSGYRQVFIRDTCIGASSCTPKTSRISYQPGDGAGDASKPAGPSVGASGRHIALSAQAATLFTRSVAVDDRVFLAITKSDK